MNRIYLIGMPGSGKSTSGKRLAKLLQWDFTDLDKAISKFTGKSIPDIFKDDGENAFRLHEQSCLQQTGLSTQQVIACGGGTPVWFDNMDWMLQHGLVIWLNPSLDLITTRIMHGKTKRPLIAIDSPASIKTQLERLLDVRRPYYARAHHEVQSERALMQLAPKLVTAAPTPGRTTDA